MSSQAQLAKKPSATADDIGMIRKTKHFVDKIWGLKLNAKRRIPRFSLFTLLLVLHYLGHMFEGNLLGVLQNVPSLGRTFAAP